MPYHWLQLGPKSTSWLRRINITTLRDLQRRGARQVYRDLIGAGHPRNKNMWYALRGAELGVPWQIIAKKEKAISTEPVLVEPPSRTARIAGVGIKYWEVHPKQKQLLFFWHGFRGSHQGLMAVADLLTDYRVIIPDLPGWGASDALPVEHTMTNTIRWMKKFIATFHAREYTLAGHSFGATLALMFAARYPEQLRQLVLVQLVVNASSFTTKLGEVYYETAAKLPGAVRRQLIARPLLNRGKSELISVETNLKRRRQLMANEQKNLAYVRDWVEIEMYRSLAKTDFWAAMKMLEVPVTLLAGTQDRLTPLPTSRKIAASLPGHELVIMKGAGHFVPMEQPALLAQTLTSVFRQPAGRDKNVKTCYTLSVQNPTSGAPTFSGLGIAPNLFEAIQRAGYVTPTPIQHQSIPIAIEGKDMIGIAQTGTGKTLAFGIPMIQRLAQVKGRGLVVLPTRELALQVEESLHKIGKAIGLRTAVLIGGQSMQPQLQAIRRNPHIIIVTPGRLIDHLEQRTLTLHDIRVLVLDEADRMLDMGFAPQISRILTAVPKERQTMLFSATMPDDIVRIASKHMALPVRVEIARAGTTAANVTQELFVVPKESKLRLLEKLLGEYRGSILVFSRTKHGAKKIARQLKTMGHTAADIHSDRSLAQRREALSGFKSGKYRVLVATDIAARGIDVSGIEVVINFDLPSHAEDYVHRIGRTGRAGLAGTAISFAQPDQRRDVQDIERLIRTTLKMKPLPSDLPAPRVPEHPTFVVPHEGRLGRQFRRRAHRSGGHHQRRSR